MHRSLHTKMYLNNHIFSQGGFHAEKSWQPNEMVQADDFGEVQQEAGVKGNDPKVAGNLRRRELGGHGMSYASEPGTPKNSWSQ